MTRTWHGFEILREIMCTACLAPHMLRGQLSVQTAQVMLTPLKLRLARGRHKDRCRADA